MNTRAIAKLGAIACVLALALAALAGCASSASVAATEAQQQNRDSMSQGHLLMTDLESDLSTFVDAVSRDDLVNMRTQADNAYKKIDKLGELEVPEAMEDIHQKYVEGTGKLREALDAYIALYTDIQSATDSNPFDWSTYDKRMASIQALYDEGVETLQAADEIAANKE